MIVNTQSTRNTKKYVISVLLISHFIIFLRGVITVGMLVPTPIYFIIRSVFDALSIGSSLSSSPISTEDHGIKEARKRESEEGRG